MRERSCSFEMPGFFCGEAALGLPAWGLLGWFFFCSAMMFTHFPQTACRRWSEHRGNRQKACLPETAGTSCRGGQRHAGARQARANCLCAAPFKYLPGAPGAQEVRGLRANEIYDRLRERPRAARRDAKPLGGGWTDGEQRRRMGRALKEMETRG